MLNYLNLKEVGYYPPEEKKTITERIVLLQLFLPKNFSRVTPIAYIFLISLFALIIGLMFVHFLAILVVLGGFMLLLFALYAVFWKWPIINNVLGV